MVAGLRPHLRGRMMERGTRAGLSAGGCMGWSRGTQRLLGLVAVVCVALFGLFTVASEAGVQRIADFLRATVEIGRRQLNRLRETQ